MSRTEVEHPIDLLGPRPETAYLDAEVEAVANPAELPFDPIKLREKYLAERNSRLKEEGLDQYRSVQGSLSQYQVDPWIEPGFSRDPVDEDVDVVVIGGGYGAQLAAVRLIESGITKLRIIEKGGGFGGTWYWNRYPGAQCDIESYVYMPLLEELNYMPTEKYAHAAELLMYSEMIGKHFGLYDRALFQTEARALTWHDDSSRWTVQTSRGDSIRARFVIPCAGPLHKPKLPGLPIETFTGHSFHSSRWDYKYSGGDTTGNLTKLQDKRVAIIGTGATAVQIVPHVGQWAKETYVFQRTPSSIDVRANRPTDPNWAASLKPGWQQERMENFNALVNGADQEVDLVDDGWTSVLHKLLARKVRDADDPEQAAADRQLADFQQMNNIRARCDKLVQDPSTANALKPWYNQLCKRPCFHDEYLQTFNRPNVHLVDTRGAGVQDITPTGIRANDTDYPVDCIIYATGFELSTAFTQRTNMEVHGRHGLKLSESWSKGPNTFHGWTTRDFPNCFWISVVQAALTPNFLHAADATARHIAAVIRMAFDRDVDTVEPTQAAQDDWVATVRNLAALRSKSSMECTPGYYNNEGKIDPEGARTASFGGGSLVFFQLLEEWRENGEYEGLDLKYVSR